MNQPTRRDVLATGLVALGAGVPALAADGTAPAAASCHFDHVLGTSLDVHVVGAASTERVEAAVLDEVERLRRVFSTYDPDSELSRLNRATGPFPASAELCEVLREYEAWQRRSGGACSAQLGGLTAFWQECERTGVEPQPTTLARLVAAARRPGWALDTARRIVTRRGDAVLNLNSIAKGYILQRATAAVRAACPGLSGLLVNLGGDLAVVGDEAPGRAGWRLGVQDPFQAAENAPFFTTLRLRDAAVATSGGYQRGYTVGGRRLSHLIDPRTGRPATEVAAATVVAPTNVAANALATILCVLSPEEGLRLVGTVPGAACLIVRADGRAFRSPGFAALETQPVAVAADEPKEEGWPEGRQVSIALEIPRPMGGRGARRPYVAVWVEDAAGKPVRTLAVWGNGKWLNTLTTWWKIARNNADLVRGVTRATRAPGKYDLVWDGKDDKGRPVAQGTYTIQIETHREHGKHTMQSGKITCGTEDASAVLEKNAEIEATRVQYAAKK